MLISRSGGISATIKPYGFNHMYNNLIITKCTAIACLFTSPIVAQAGWLEPDFNIGNGDTDLYWQSTGNSTSTDQVPFGADSIHDTSEYALGSFTHNIIFIQDDQLRNLDDSEHPKVSASDCVTINCGQVYWTGSMISTRKQRITDAASFWNSESLNRHHPAAQFTITTNFINDEYNNGDAFTIDDIGDGSSSIGFLDALSLINTDYGTYSSFQTGTRHLNDDIRRSLGTHWAVTTFVKPYYGRATASMNGPYTKGYEDDPSWTYAHELGHIFGAKDEYGSHETDERSGYLYSYNTNAAYLPGGTELNPNSVSAIMKTHGSYFISDGAIDAIGWRDTDDDTIPDILDTFPTISVDTSGNLPSVGFFQAQIDATVTPLPSPDPYEDDFTINTLTSAQYRVDGGSWTDLLPIDSVFGDYVEHLQLETVISPLGDHLIDFQIFNSVGNYTDHQFLFTVTPEPATATLAAIGFLLLLGGRTYHKSRRHLYSLKNTLHF